MREIKEEFIIQDVLNPKLFQQDKLIPEVRSHMISVVEEFLEYSQIPVTVLDIQLCGSNCNYNYSDSSDIDLHIIANFEDVTDDTYLLGLLYNSKKSSFNNNYNITIKGLDVEIYIQDVKAGIVSNGIYSVQNDEWIKHPDREKLEIKKPQGLHEAVAKWKASIEEAISSFDIDTIQNAINQLYILRHDSLATGGEYSLGNQVFKELRNEGLIELLKEARIEEKSKELSLESLMYGQIINRME